MTIFHWEKSSVLRRKGTNDTSWAYCLDNPAINILIQAENRKVKLMCKKNNKIKKVSLKNWENEKLPFLYAQPSEKSNKT